MIFIVPLVYVLFIWNAPDVTWRFLLLGAVLTVIPGRLHNIAGHISQMVLKIFTVCYLSIQLALYFGVRFLITFAEKAFDNPLHYRARRKIRKATSYEEWRAAAKELDLRQKRDVWQKSLDDDSSRSHNWALISELISDLKLARHGDDAITALAVLQQCTRRNVGGIMDADLFSRTHTGEPKTLVVEFVQEVAQTLEFLTEKAKLIPSEEKLGKKGENGSYTSGGRPDVIKEEKSDNAETMKNVDDDDHVEIELDSPSEKEYKKQLGMAYAKEENKVFNVKCHFERQTLADIAAEDASTNSSEMLSRASTIVAFDDTFGIEDEALLQIDEEEEESDAVFVKAHITKKTPSIMLPPSHRDRVLKFLKRARQTYGRTALCLSGGASLGFFHFGHVKALLEVDALPNIIAGASAGTLVASFVCTRTDEEIKRDMIPEVLSSKLTFWNSSWSNRIKMLLKKGHAFDDKEAFEKTAWFTCGDLTFEEAYQKTGRVLCVSVSPLSLNSPPVLLNYISAPNVVITSAVMASSSIPPALPPAVLLAKDAEGNITTQGEYFNDGSIKQDIPTARLSELLNCQFFITAQVNPHVVPFLFNNKGAVGRPTRYDGRSEESLWRGGALLSALELYLRLGIFAKFNFLFGLGATTLGAMTQEYTGSTTIVPRVNPSDFAKIVKDPTPKDIEEKIQGGSIAAYQHCALIKLHTQLADTLDECIDALENAVERTEDKKKGRQTYAWTN